MKLIIFNKQLLLKYFKFFSPFILTKTKISILELNDTYYVIKKFIISKVGIIPKNKVSYFALL